MADVNVESEILIFMFLICTSKVSHRPDNMWAFIQDVCWNVQRISFMERSERFSGISSTAVLKDTSIVGLVCANRGREFLIICTIFLTFTWIYRLIWKVTFPSPCKSSMQQVVRFGFTAQFKIQCDSIPCSPSSVHHLSTGFQQLTYGYVIIERRDN